MHTNDRFARDNSLQQFFRLIDLVFMILVFYLALAIPDLDLKEYNISFFSVSIVSFYLFAEAFGLYRFEIYHIFKSSFNKYLG